MSERIDEELLNDYVDGLLDTARRAEVDELLAGSPEARATVTFLRSLKQRADDLPASIEPRRDLWPAIAARIAPARLVRVDFGGDDAPGEASTSRSPWFPSLDPRQWGALAAAALVLVVASSAITALFLAAPAPDPGAGGELPVGVALDARPGAEYAIEIEQLLWALYENRETLDADTVTTIETNLRVIDRAIRRASEALDDDPGNAGLVRMLSSNYRHKLELLQRANRIIERS